MTRNTMITDAVEKYVSAMTRETPLQAELRQETMRSIADGQMMTPPDVAALLGLLVRISGAKRAIEVGTFTGYGSLAIASALPADGKLICCDISEEWTAIGKRYWERAGVAARIDLRLAPARETLATLAASEAGRFDFAFIDADKGGYDAYYEACLTLMRCGGVIALDNMLWYGAVADSSVRDADTLALRALNEKIRDDDRVDACLLSVGDGVMVARKR
jgi:predicted O-methyltransferase YrrM